MILPDIKIRDLERNLSEIEKQKSFRFLGYILIPFIIGFFIITKANRNILKYTKKINKNIYIIINELKNSNETIKNELSKIIIADKYLTYSVKTTLSEKLNNQLIILHKIQKKIIILKNSELNNCLDLSIKKVTNSINTVENYNQEFILRKKTEYEFLFKKSTVKLNDEQKTAIITDDKHNLVVAGAGSGKTEVLIIRIAYLILRKQNKISPNRILVLAFQNKAAKEIQERLNKRFGIEVKIKTFHSLGNEILRESALNPKMKFNGDNFDFEYRNFIKNLFKNGEKDPQFQKRLIDYMKYFGDDKYTKKESDFKTKERWYNYMRDLDYITLNGTRVKSEGEREIMNFFLSHKINGKKIKVQYEQPAEWMEYSNEKGEIKKTYPDFFLPDYNIYIEHWGINENGKVPQWFEKDTITYKKGMNLKIEKFKQQTKYSLIETTYGEFKQKMFFDNLEKKIVEEIESKNAESKVVLSPLDYSELVQIVWKDCKESLRGIHSDIATFIVKAKTNGFQPNDIQERLEKEGWSKKQIAFSNIALIIYNEYENELRNKNEIDFSDMINLALIELKKNEQLFENIYDHILIDEYQDISKQRYLLIKALMNKNKNCKLFCVGDDWQSIMGFTGSNLDMFLNFEKYFDHPARTDLSMNYRSIKSIVDAGADLIKFNGNAQLKKKTMANNNEEKKIMVYSYSHEDKWMYQKQTAIHCVDMIKEYLSNGYRPQDIMILCRIVNNPRLINPLKEHAKNSNILIGINSRNPNAIPLMSVHKSKGLQAKVLFLLCVDEGLYGFPCRLEDSLIFEPAMDTKYNNKEEEERRLFYVAITRSKEDVLIYTQKSAKSLFLNEIEKHIDVVDFGVD
ncbi:MAG: UvrD-helicase domain-containing protein [ANME-2 cluster archaeon]|nr:UvrD-helicase domain-containing protein [ANME-2 cluster archaeon]